MSAPREIYHLWEGVLDKTVCDRIISLTENCEFREGEVFSDPDKLSPRQVSITHIDSPELRDIQMTFFSEANRMEYGFYIDHLPPAQFSQYREGDFYNWHHDIDWCSSLHYDRKLSMTIQLSDENDYEGGDLEFLEWQHPIKGIRTRGSVIVFPSYLTHRVTKITDGCRESLTNWIEGPRFR